LANLGTLSRAGRSFGDNPAGEPHRHERSRLSASTDDAEGGRYHNTSYVVALTDMMRSDDPVTCYSTEILHHMENHFEDSKKALRIYIPW
jgi:hypothetical protein